MHNLNKLLGPLHAAFLPIIIACLLFLNSANASALTICELVQSLADMAQPGDVVEHKTDFSDEDCTTQLTAKVEKSEWTTVDFKIDRSCNTTGQTQLTTTFEMLPSNPAETICEVDYDNPSDPTSVGQTTNITDVPALKQLISDAATATTQQFPAGIPTADFLVEGLTSAISPAFPTEKVGFDMLISIDGVPQAFTFKELFSQNGFGRRVPATQDTNNIIRFAVEKGGYGGNVHTVLLHASRYGSSSAGTTVGFDIQYVQGLDGPLEYAYCQVGATGSHQEVLRISNTGVFELITTAPTFTIHCYLNSGAYGF